MARHHLARCSGVLAFGFAVEIAGPDGHDMQQRCQRNQNHQQSVARGRRRQAPAAPAAFLQGLKCVRLRSLFTFSTGNRSGSRFGVRDL